MQCYFPSQQDECVTICRLHDLTGITPDISVRLLALLYVMHSFEPRLCLYIRFHNDCFQTVNLDHVLCWIGILRHLLHVALFGYVWRSVSLAEGTNSNYLGSEPATFRKQLTTTSHGSRTRTTAERGEQRMQMSPLGRGGPCIMCWWKFKAPCTCMRTIELLVLEKLKIPTDACLNVCKIASTNKQGEYW